MMNTAKNTIRLTICLLAGLVLGNCFSQWKGDDATITIYLGGGANREVYTPDDDTLERLVYVVNLSGPSTFTAGPTAPGAKSVSISLYPGIWNITVTAYLDGPDGPVYATGSETIEARAGQSASISITMRFVGEKEYTITFISNGGSDVAPQTVTEGETAARPDNPTRNGYGFVRWCPDETLATEYHFDTPVTEDITLYAQWSATTFTITFNGNGGTPATVTAIVGEGGTATPPDPPPTRAGYAFDDWYADASLKDWYDFDARV